MSNENSESRQLLKKACDLENCAQELSQMVAQEHTKIAETIHKVENTFEWCEMQLDSKDRQDSINCVAGRLNQIILDSLTRKYFDLQNFSNQIEGELFEEMIIECLNAAFSTSAVPYSGWKLINKATTRDIFEVYRGHSEKKQHCVCKIDKDSVHPRGNLLSDKGYNTKNELEWALSITPSIAYQNHLIPVIDGFKHPGFNCIVEEFYEHETLGDRVSKKIFEKDEFKVIFSNVIEAVSFIIREGRYHGDLHPGNILIGKTQEGGIEARLTDFALVRKIGDIKDYPDESLPEMTYGARCITHPKVYCANDREKYGEFAECYAIGMNMIYAITGKFPWRYEPSENFNPAVHNSRVKQVLSELPSEFIEYKPMLERCFSLDESVRYNTFAELKKDFAAVASKKKESVWQKIKKAGLGIIAASMLFNPFGNILNNNTYPLATSNVRDFEIESSLFEPGVVLRNKDKGTFLVQKPTTTNPSNEQVWYAAAGDKISYAIIYNEKFGPATFEKDTDLEARIYLEGEDGMAIKFTPDKSLLKKVLPYGMPEGEISIPSDFEDGVYNLVFELYSPGKGKSKTIEFPTHGQTIFRECIPLIVGKVDVPIIVDTATLSFKEGIYEVNVSVRQVVQNDTVKPFPEDIKCYATRLGTFNEPVPCLKREMMDGFSHLGHYFYFGLKLPEESSEEIIIIDVEHKDKLINRAYIPFTAKSSIFGSSWSKGVYDYNFERRIAEYEKENSK